MQKGKRMRTVFVSVLALLVAGCAAQPPVAPPPPAAGMHLVIRYETGPCFGFCPVYTVTVSQNGSGTFEGKQHTAVTGTRIFTVTPEHFAAFRDRLEPYRPYDVGERRIADPNCGGLSATDFPSVDITWTEKAPQHHLHAYYGCDMERNAGMFKALQDAPEVLPIRAFIGRG